MRRALIGFGSFFDTEAAATGHDLDDSDGDARDAGRANHPFVLRGAPMNLRSISFARLAAPLFLAAVPLAFVPACNNGEIPIGSNEPISCNVDGD